MKRLIVIIIVLAFATNGFAQIQKIKAGCIFIPNVDLSSGNFAKMKPEFALLSNVNFITKHSYHNLCYVWGANAFVLVNGWVYDPNGKQDIYFVFSKNLSASGGNAKIAWEQELTDGPIPSYLAFEIGTPWNAWNKLLINFSLTIPIDAKVWIKK